MRDGKKVAINYIFNASYQIMALIVPIITTPYISRVLRADGIGVYSYTYSIVCYFTLCAILGTATFGNRQIGVLQDDPIGRTKKFWDILIFRVITSSLALAIYITYVFCFADNKVIALLQSIYILGVMFDVSWFFQGMEDFRQIAIRNYTFKIINVISIFLFVHQYSDLWKYVLLLSLTTWLGNLSVWPFLRRYLVKLSSYRVSPFSDIKMILQLFLPTAAMQIYAIIDKTMIGQITADAAQNGYYEQAEKIVKMCLMLVTSLPTVLLPKVSKAYAEKRIKDANDYLYKAYKLVWFLGTPLMCGTIAISSVLVPVFFGEGYEPVINILPIMSLLFIVMGLNHTSGTQFFIASGRQNEYTIRIIIGGLVNVLLNMLLIYDFGATGAAIASVVGEIIIMLTEFRYVYKHKMFSVGHLFGECRKYFVAGIVMVGVLKLLILKLPVGISSLAGLVVVGMVIYIGILLIEKEEFVSSGLSVGKSILYAFLKKVKRWKR